MKRALAIALAFFIGAAIGYAICLGLYIAFTVIADFSDREGATGMAVAFFIGPLVALVTGIAAGIWAALRSARRST